MKSIKKSLKTVKILFVFLPMLALSNNMTYAMFGWFFSNNKEEKEESSQKPTGLANLGNTCFMNAVVQCLNQAEPIAEFLLAKLQYYPENQTIIEKNCSIICNYIEQLEQNSEISPNWQVTDASEKVGQITGLFPFHTNYPDQELNEYLLQNKVSYQDLPMAIKNIHLFAKLINQLKQGKTNIRPNEFVNTCLKNLITCYQKGYQQDAPELLDNLLNHIMISHAPLLDIVNGGTTGQLMCKGCNNTKPLPVNKHFSIQVEIKGNTLINCLNSQFAPERLEDNIWCPYCSNYTPTNKELKLARTPKILAIQLKRFKYDSTENRRNQYQKIKNPIKFPLTNLDINNYLVLNNQEKNTKYDLFAFVCHQGEYKSGHYVSFAKNYQSRKWYLFDDSTVTNINDNTVKKIASSNGQVFLRYSKCKEALFTPYLLFYQRNDENYDLEEKELEGSEIEMPDINQPEKNKKEIYASNNENKIKERKSRKRKRSKQEDEQIHTDEKLALQLHTQLNGHNHQEKKGNKKRKIFHSPKSSKK